MSVPQKPGARGGNKPVRKKKTKRSLLSPARSAAFSALQQVMAGQSLSAVQVKRIDTLPDRRDRGLAHELVNGVLRWRWRLAFYISRLVSRPLKKKDHDVQLVLLMAMYELQQCRTPDYAIINEAVELVRSSGKRWADGLVNAVLRRFVREQQALQDSIAGEQAEYAHPQWIIDRLKHDWPLHWQSVLQANNQRPPLWLRVNRRQLTRDDYRDLLLEQELDTQASELSNVALKLEQGLDVTTLPGFGAGMLSVQDVGAQLCAGLLDVTARQRVLDLCAAPGGKTCHLLESHFDVAALVAVELDAARMSRVEQNLQRLQLDAHAALSLLVADARDFDRQWQGESFDRILIDAPCSASGVIRRHPDIKSLRRDEDIAALVDLQADILRSAWSLLKRGGELLYVTCSVFNDENSNQIERFLKRQDDARHIVIDAAWGVPCGVGRQLLPGESDADGFYFCKLEKK